MKKLELMILCIIIFFSFFLISYFKKRSYDLTYELSGYKIKEKYILDDKTYYVTLQKNKEKYNFIISDNYSKKRKLVNNIKKYKTENEVCLTIKFNGKNINPICNNNESLISHYLVSDEMKSKLSSKFYKYKNTSKTKEYNILVNDLLNKKVLIWNYHGLIYLDKNENKEIKLFNVDTYNPTMIGEVKNYLVIPNYDSLYEYNEFKIFNVKTKETKNFKLNDNISTDSYFLGTNDDSIFLFDPKYEKEYELVPFKKVYREVNPFIYEKGKKVNKTAVSLSNKITHFTYDTIYNYKLENNKLYQINKYNNDKTLIDEGNIKEIVKENNEYVYYIKDDKLYSYSNKYGIVKMLEYFELNFNYANLIYIFD